jgi:crotonobetainyl-CoA hydratase
MNAGARLEIDGAVAVLTLDRPQALNAINAELSGAIGAALEEIDANPSVRVAVVTGAGRAFCAGGDLKAIAAGLDVSAPGRPEWGFAGLVDHRIRKPVIAAVNGIAFGGGTEIVLSCDLAVMSEDASLGLPEVKRGLFAAAGGLIELPRQVPVKLAMAWALTGDPIPAATALQWGLVNRVVSAELVLSTAHEIASRIAANPPLAVELTKGLVKRAAGNGSDWDFTLRGSQEGLFAVLAASRDAMEGATAFAEKREPVWTGS